MFFYTRPFVQKLFVLLVVGFFASSTTVFAYHNDTPASHDLSEQEIVDLVKPAIVRIGQHVEGTISIPPFSVDLLNLEVEPGDEALVDVPIDQYLSGTGFVIHPDGYILTNAHVGSEEAVTNVLLQQVSAQVLLEKLFELTDEEYEEFDKYTEEEGRVFVDEMISYMKDNGEFDIETTLTVLDQSVEAHSIQEAIDDGISAEVVYANPRYYLDDKDVAIIQMSGSDFPSIPLASDGTMSVGDDIFLFGFPSNAQASANDLFEPTFTSGSIGGEKQTTSEEFKFLQTDAKISSGSSGGPLVNRNGEVAGIVMAQTNPFASNGGDNFAFALPLSVVNEALNEALISDRATGYYETFKEGLVLEHQRHCEAAIENFEKAQEFAATNSVAQEAVASHIENCEALIEQGASIDGAWDEFVDRLDRVDNTVWAFIGVGVLTAIILVIVIVFLSRRLKQEGEEIDNLEEIIEGHHHEQEKEPQKQTKAPLDILDQQKEKHGDEGRQEQEAKTEEQGAQHKESTAPQADPAVTQYVKDARAANMDDDAIREALIRAGWSNEEIEKALEVR